MFNTLTIGKPAPDFTLNDLDGKAHSLSDLRGRIAILNFWSAECPWSARADKVLIPELGRWRHQVELVIIASNANEPLDLIARAASERQVPVVLVDPHQVVTDLYGAVTTPHFFVLDAQGLLRYQGALDDITFRKREASRIYLIEAVDALIQGRLPNPAYTTPYGCTVVRYSPNFQ